MYICTLCIFVHYVYLYIMYISTLCIFVHYVYLYIIYICTLLEIQGALRPSSISTFNCGFISEHLLFVQYKTKTKT